MSGRIRAISRRAARDSGSERARGPEYSPPPSGCQRKGKLRLRSTPWAFPLVPAATPSGLSEGTIQSAASRGAGAAISRRAIRVPAASLPCTQPITSTRSGASSSPLRTATSGRPSTECPTTLRRGSAAAAAAQASQQITTATATIGSGFGLKIPAG